MKFYTGIGSRQTPDDVTALMSAIAQHFQQKEWVLRSGGANGADTAFQEGITDTTQQRIFIPWNGFNKLRHDPANHIFLATELPNYDKAIKLAKNHYKHWDDLRDPIKNLHARNMFQLMGEDLNDPSEFVIFWAETHPKYGFKGGTGFTIRVAKALNIPYYNLADSRYRERMIDLVKVD
jgi:hypothetical protein